MTDYWIYFRDTEGNQLGSVELMPIPLRVGMQITIHGCQGVFEVIDWNFHYGHGDEDPGLRVILREKNRNDDF